MFVFTYDGGNSWFETEMIKNGEDHQAILSDIPDQGTLIYFLKIIDVFDEEFIDNNNNQYYSLPYICPLEPSVLQEDPNQDTVPNLEDSLSLDSDSSEIEQKEINPSESEMMTVKEIENDNSLSLNADDMSIDAANGVVKADADLEGGDEGALVENPLENQTFEDDEKEDDESADSDELDSSGSEAAIYDSKSFESKDNEPKIIEKNDQIDDKTILLNRSPLSYEKIDIKQNKKTPELIKPVAPKKIIMQSQSKPESPETVSKTSLQTKTTNINTQAEIKTYENAASVFLRGLKKDEKKNIDKGNQSSLSMPSPPELIPSESTNSQEPSLPQEQKELMDKIFALSRYKAKQELEKETQTNLVGKGSNKNGKEFEKTKLNLAKLDSKNNIDAKMDENGTKNISPLFSLENIPIKIKHPFSTAMYEYISKNGSLVTAQDPKLKKKEEKSNKKPCRKCEAVILREWKICPICGAKN